MSNLDILHTKILSSEEHAALINSLTEEGRKQLPELIRTIVIETARADSIVNNPDHDEDDPSCLNYTLLEHFDIKL